MDSELETYLRRLAGHLVHELEPILRMPGVTRNTDLLGTYTEAAVRRLIARIAYPMRVSSGSVIDFPEPHVLPQFDAIVWAPFPVPGLFEVGEFALVPRSSAFGLLEIKRSDYSGVDVKLTEFSERAQQFAASPMEGAEGQGRFGLGVVCVLTGSPSSSLQALLSDGRAVAIFRKTEADSDTAEVRVDDVFRLVNFVHFIGWRYRRQSTQGAFPQIVPTDQSGQ